MTQSSNKWWEFYFVRYFIGSIFGSLIILALVFHPDSSLSTVIYEIFQPNHATIAQNTPTDSILELKGEHFWVILLLGISFCYIASAPVLILHTCRAHLNENSDIALSFKWVLIMLVVILLFFILGQMSFLEGDLCSKENIILLLSHTFPALAFLFILSIQYSLILLTLKHKESGLFKFYSNLTNHRSNIDNNKHLEQYIESYKHLREHGNAFLILFFELALGSVLFLCSSVNYAILVLIVWLVPSMFVWRIGIFLESKIGEVTNSTAQEKKNDK